MRQSPSWRVPPLDKQVLASLCTAVLRAKLDAQTACMDLAQQGDNVFIDHMRYWQSEADRLEVGHNWLLELLGSAQP